ncbi:DUF1801 domain-containing protein [Pedobacter sp. HMF7647]|uniref:DUF1801 domain-containing protein n=1 Tax=Hufsiella arboris TaxID=2695275 RepID=A0A7K1YE16_9SPHI|nr:DUF1801 domain-containing protein [Hufsiella arboris]MXV52854.1 DUF1801 domain-containing protein [Hufsiella arboris]
MQSKANSAVEYISELPADRKEVIAAIREVIIKNLPAGFEEIMNYGMLCYVVPHKIYPPGYHCNPKDPLPFISLASQKNYISFYYSGFYDNDLLNWLTEQYTILTGKKPDIGKCCIRFKKPAEIPVALLGELCTKITPDEWIAHYEKHVKR